jgi:hypothetical protein
LYAYTTVLPTVLEIETPTDAIALFCNVNEKAIFGDGACDRRCNRKL